MRPLVKRFKSMKQAAFIGTLAAVLTLSGCSPAPDQQKAGEQPGTYWPGDTWLTATPESQGVDSQKLLSLFETLETRGVDMHHVLILKNGYKIAEANYYPYAASDQHLVNSVTKSVTSAAIGKAIDEGLIPSVDEPVLAFFKDRPYENPSDLKNTLSLKHLLTMSTGFNWSEDGNYGADYDSNTLMWRSDNQIQYMLDTPVIEAPGTQFYYATGASHLLSGIITEAAKRPASEYVKEKIFTPIGIKHYAWDTDKQGNSAGGSRLFLTAEDLARFGYLYLNDGKWQDQEVLSAKWIQESTSKHMETPDGLAGHDGYGYQWWINPYGGYSARGYGGQYLFVQPEQNIVAVFMGSLGSTFFLPESLVGDYLVTEETAVDTLPENPAAQKQLTDKLSALAQPPSKKEIPALPAATAEWTGKSYELGNGETLQVDFVAGSPEATLHWFTDGVLYEVPVGLDNLYRLSDCPDFYMKGKVSRVGFRGTFDSDGAFVIDVCPTDGDATYTLTLTYANGTLDSQFINNLTGR